MYPTLITYDDAIDRLSWTEAVDALRAGHLRPKAQVADMFLGPAAATLLSRGAFIDGLGYGVKSVTVLDGNAAQGVPTVQGAMLVFEPRHGRLEAIIDSRLVTEFKTAADSVLGASCLARPDSAHLLVVGAGTAARSLVGPIARASRAFVASRSGRGGRSSPSPLPARSAGEKVPVVAVPDLAKAVVEADIITSATMAREPVLRGALVRPGTHVDLVGAYKADMREADDGLISRGSCSSTAGRPRSPTSASSASRSRPASSRPRT